MHIFNSWLLTTQLYRLFIWWFECFLYIYQHNRTFGCVRLIATIASHQLFVREYCWPVVKSIDNFIPQKLQFNWTSKMEQKILTSTSVLYAGRYCLCSSINIFKQTSTFSSFSISISFSIRISILLTYGLNVSLIGKRWIISSINFLTCWILYSAMKWGSPSCNILRNIFKEWSKNWGYCGELSIT